MSSYQELLAQRDVLEKRIAEEYSRLRLDAIVTVKGLRDAYSLTEVDIFSTSSSPHTQRQPAKVAPKYRDPSTGNTWTGRGKPPAWIRNKDRSAFQIIAPPQSSGQ